MCTYKQFLATTDRQHSAQSELDYETYAQAYRDNQIRVFFNTHKDEPWIMERYYPLEAEKRFAERLLLLRGGFSVRILTAPAGSRPRRCARSSL